VQAQRAMVIRTSVVRDYFINDCCFGGDCAAWFAAELRAEGLAAVNAPWQEDWGWQFSITVDASRFLAGVGLIPETEPLWLVQVHAQQPVLQHWFGRPNLGAARPRAASQRDGALSLPSHRPGSDLVRARGGGAAHVSLR
jgi:hypothetical protein